MSIAPSLPRVMTEPIVRAALLEDLGRAGDITADATIPEDTQATIVMAARQGGVVAGIDLAAIAFELVDPTLEVKTLITDGSTVAKGDKVMRVAGSARAILTAERVALNFAGHLSGVATLAHQMVQLVEGTSARIVCTRKTTPGLRALEKRAVRLGGAANHRLGLDDAILIKDNHIAVAGGITAAVTRARQAIGHLVKIEVECDTLDQVTEAASLNIDVIMLDNMAPAELREAVSLIDGRAITEASGGINADSVRAVAEAGVDYISSGAITHSAPSLDLGLDFETLG
jgi:nicotinate-nucleotide pyrophosphorylase (carboxylating)